jgi:hypothetical protein
MLPFFTSSGTRSWSVGSARTFPSRSSPDRPRRARQRPAAKHVESPALMRDFLLMTISPSKPIPLSASPSSWPTAHPRFYIQLLFWMDGTTAIHQHEFSGAFHVMHGSSIHAHYEFEKAQPVTPYLRVGNVKMKKMEILEIRPHRADRLRPRIFIPCSTWIRRRSRSWCAPSTIRERGRNSTTCRRTSRSIRTSATSSSCVASNCSTCWSKPKTPAMPSW